MAILSGQVALPMAKLEKFQAAEWKARRWAWVDPTKDVNAKILAIENGFESRRGVISENGGDIEDTFQELAQDEELAESYGLKFGSTKEAHDEAQVILATSEAAEANATAAAKRKPAS